jgi:predicted transcriptional regulator
MVWIFSGKKRLVNLEEETKRSFLEVKNDFQGVGKWIKHLNEKDKQVFEILNELKREIASINDEVESIKEIVSLSNFAHENKQVLKKQTGVGKQTGVYGVEEPVQTGVQTGNFYNILEGLSSNERMIIFTLMNADMKLSYEDIARLLGKERSTIRGQINAIKKKKEGLILERIEGNGKKRVFMPEEMKEKLEKYAKVRVKNEKKYKKLPKNR